MHFPDHLPVVNIEVAAPFETLGEHGGIYQKHNMKCRTERSQLDIG